MQSFVPTGALLAANVAVMSLMDYLRVKKKGFY
jgi:hypothetical protein